jgi:hypothetical protein
MSRVFQLDASRVKFFRSVLAAFEPYTVVHNFGFGSVLAIRMLLSPTPLSVLILYFSVIPRALVFTRGDQSSLQGVVVRGKSLGIAISRSIGPSSVVRDDFIFRCVHYSLQLRL